MRDAFGGEFMIRIFLIFILIYILLTAVAMNYAKAYKVKELVIAYLEDNEIYDITHMTAEESKAMEDYIVKKVVGDLNYSKSVNYSCPADKECLKTFEKYGITIEKEDTGSNSNKLGAYYVVTTYFGYDIGFIKLLSAAQGNASSDTNSFGTWKITGETRLTYNEKIKEG